MVLNYNIGRRYHSAVLLRESWKQIAILIGGRSEQTMASLYAALLIED